MDRAVEERTEAMAPQDKSPNANNSALNQLKNQFTSWLKETNPEWHDRIEVTLDSAAQLADQGIESAKATLDLLGAFASELTGIESFRIIPKTSIAIEVDIRCKQNQQIPVRQQVAPFVEIRALALGRRINFEALVNRSRKGLQLDINDGMSVIIDAPLVGPQTVPIKGSGLLTRDEKGQAILAVTSKLPGFDEQVTVNVPLKHFASGIQSHLKKKFNSDR